MSFAHTRRRWLGLIAALSWLGGGISQAAGPDVKVHLMGIHQPAGTPEAKWASLSDKTKVAPGDRILYKIQLANRGDREASHASALGPIPAGTAYVAGTASTSPGLRIDYSVDGGKSFSSSPTITLTGKDGKPQVVPAPADRYTTVRWTWNTPLPAGAEANVSYQVQVR